jgi:hypothetical protein
MRSAMSQAVVWSSAMYRHLPARGVVAPQLVHPAVQVVEAVLVGGQDLGRVVLVQPVQRARNSPSGLSPACGLYDTLG